MTKRLLLLLLPLSVLLMPLPTRGQAGGRAGLIVQFSDGSVRTSCVAFEGESITSFELLQRGGLDVIAQASGNNAAVCKIGGDGCNFPAEPCFCKFGSGQQGLYWAFWRLGASGWQYASQGAGQRRISNGEVDGWAWGSGNVQSGTQPPIIPFEQICPTAPPPPTAVPPTAAPPTAIPTVPLTVLPTPRPATAVPTVQATAPVVASAPTSTPRPSETSTPISASVTPTQAATASATPTATAIAPSATAVATLTVEPLSSATPTQAATTSATPASAVAGRAGSSAGSYIVFGTMLIGLLGVIGLALWRRRR